MYSYSGNSSVAYPAQQTVVGTCRCTEHYGTDNLHYFSPNRCGNCNGTLGHTRVEYFNEIRGSETNTGSTTENIQELYLSKQDFLARGGKRRKQKSQKQRQKPQKG